MFYEVIIDAGESPNKCTIAPLQARSDFHLMRAKGPISFGPLRSSVLLHHEGDCLTGLRDSLRAQDDLGIATIDCIWRRLESLRARIIEPLPLLARIPAQFETAYPRRSKSNSDPSGGLATIEAIFVAAALLGHWDLTLFQHYYFAGRFLEINKPHFSELGIVEALDDVTLPVVAPRGRHAAARRRARGHEVELP